MMNNQCDEIELMAQIELIAQVAAGNCAALGEAIWCRILSTLCAIPRAFDTCFRKAMKRVPPQDSQSLAESKQRLELYLAHKPYRDAPLVPETDP